MAKPGVGRPMPETSTAGLRGWSVPLKSWTGNKEIEEQRTRAPHETKSGPMFGGDEIDAAPFTSYTPTRS